MDRAVPVGWKDRIVAIAISVILISSLAPYFYSSSELVKLRNALLYEREPAQAGWTPESVPADYLVDRGPPSQLFSGVVREHGLVVPGDDWNTALRIGRHLLSPEDGSIRSNPIQDSLSETYHRITRYGDGYCGDYADVFTGLAEAAGVFSRAWAFSFDGFGGHGHIFNEVWDRGSRSWRMIDPFHNYYVVDGNERPLSALEFRAALERGDEIRWRAINASARPGFKYPEKAVEYYRRGLDQWYLWWGNNVFDYERHRVVAAAADVARPLEQLAAIASGVHPGVRILQEPDNASERAGLLRLRYQLILVLIALPLLAVVIVVASLRLRRTHPTKEAPALGAAP